LADCYRKKHKNEKRYLYQSDVYRYLFSFYVFGRILWMIYRKLRKIIELRDWQPPAVCDNICVGTFINV